MDIANYDRHNMPPKNQLAKAIKPTDAQFDEHIQKIKDRTAAVQIQQKSKIDERRLQDSFEFWDDNNRGVPNPLIRGGIFGVGTNEVRKFLSKHKIPSLSNYSITYTGQDLQQDDLTIWLALINLARNQPMSDAIYFTGYSLIKDIGWRMHSDSYKRARESIDRLKVTAIEISTVDQTKGYAGSLIRDYSWDEKDDRGKTRWMVRFEPRVSILFMNDTTTLLEWQVRKQIGTRATTAQWLHAYYSSHRDPYPITIDKIYELCRSNDDIASFKHTLIRALNKLIEVGFLSKFEIQGRTVHVWKKIRSQLLAVKR